MKPFQILFNNLPFELWHPKGYIEKPMFPKENMVRKEHHIGHSEPIIYHISWILVTQLVIDPLCHNYIFTFYFFFSLLLVKVTNIALDRQWLEQISKGSLTWKTSNNQSFSNCLYTYKYYTKDINQVPYQALANSA